MFDVGNVAVGSWVVAVEIGLNTDCLALLGGIACLVCVRSKGVGVRIMTFRLCQACLLL